MIRFLEVLYRHGFENIAKLYVTPKFAQRFEVNQKVKFKLETTNIFEEMCDWQIIIFCNDKSFSKISSAQIAIKSPQSNNFMYRFSMFI